MCLAPATSDRLYSDRITDWLTSFLFFFFTQSTHNGSTIDRSIAINVMSTPDLHTDKPKISVQTPFQSQTALVRLTIGECSLMRAIILSSPSLTYLLLLIQLTTPSFLNVYKLLVTLPLPNSDLNHTSLTEWSSSQWVIKTWNPSLSYVVSLKVQSMVILFSTSTCSHEAMSSANMECLTIATLMTGSALPSL